MSNQKGSVLDVVTLNKIVDQVLNEEDFSSSDDSNVSNDNGLIESEEHNDINDAAQIIPSKHATATQKKYVSERSGHKIKICP